MATPGHEAAAQVVSLRLNGRVVGETGLNAAVCGFFGVPVIMVSGDQALCAEASELLGPIEVAVVKRGNGRMSAECLPPEASQKRIQEAAARAVGRLRAGQVPPPFRLEPPIAIALEWSEVQMTEQVSLLPGSRRVGARGIEFTAEDMPTAYRAFRAMVLLAIR